MSERIVLALSYGVVFGAVTAIGEAIFGPNDTAPWLNAGITAAIVAFAASAQYREAGP